MTKSICFFDIETTGLTDDDHVGLIGVMLCRDGDPRTSTTHLWQGDEDDVLLSAAEFFKQFGDDELLLVSYNGDSFDIPFLERCGSVNNSDLHLRRFEHLDLMGPARTYLAKEGRFISQSNACFRLGIYTPKTCDGFKCALTYRSPNMASVEDWMELLRHNFVDLEQTARMYFEFKKWALID